MGNDILMTVNWSRAQFALTAMYHWIFVPLTLGLSFLVAFFESIYLRTGDESWKKLTKFWMTLFGINFAIGVATGIIMEFQFGTNWSNYSWMVGDIFGAPLAVEGIFAFFLEATFFAVMFFGWERASKRFHLFSTWMVAIGSNLSAVWILVANGWMQNPVAMAFNPDKARFEMQNFFDVALSPTAVQKFTHTTSSSFLLASLFVMGISGLFLLQKRHQQLAKRSMVVAAVLGLVSSGFAAFNGDESAFHIAHRQPMKLAAMEGLYTGTEKAPIVAMGIINPDKKPGDNLPAFKQEVVVPGMLSLLANRDPNSFVPGINDLVYGNPTRKIVGAQERIASGKIAVAELAKYKEAKKTGDQSGAQAALALFNQHKDDLGYGYLNRPEEAVPPVPLTFYAFHVMVGLGTFFPIVFICVLFCAFRGTLENHRWLSAICFACLFLGYVASQAGWVVAEVGRQPWAIEGLLPVGVASTAIAAGSVKTTFFIFLFLFTGLLIAEIGIMVKQIKIGPEA
ncbi:cytochrome ubiquinol oxidase subunit I [Geomonas silvestris]|uniref:Cytochrome ubiquinol oxidase subunit I n=1 Tax=Geomonas silvestris TaxID=2740184 RepID=A0A6V8MHT0_9BACT|nr:cytochrome ubiquinol oxidase subunit I [Geomonas silvestris]GFO59484.1 cytochrome ubiquinol oxidase subunit I [Geomonas silvestris]